MIHLQLTRLKPGIPTVQWSPIPGLRAGTSLSWLTVDFTNHWLLFSFNRRSDLSTSLLGAQSAALTGVGATALMHVFNVCNTYCFL